MLTQIMLLGAAYMIYKSDITIITSEDEERIERDLNEKYKNHKYKEEELDPYWWKNY